MQALERATSYITTAFPDEFLSLLTLDATRSSHNEFLRSHTHAAPQSLVSDVWILISESFWPTHESDSECSVSGDACGDGRVCCAVGVWQLDAVCDVSGFCCQREKALCSPDDRILRLPCCPGLTCERDMQEPGAGTRFICKKKEVGS